MDRQKVIYRREIYSDSVIDYAIFEYKKIAKIVKEIDKDNIYCIFSDCKHGMHNTVNEFNNYIIDLMNSMR